MNTKTVSGITEEFTVLVKKTYYAKFILSKYGKELIFRGSIDKRGILGKSEIWTRKNLFNNLLAL